MTTPASLPTPPPKKRRGVFARILRLCFVLFLLLVVSIFAAPLLLKTAWVKGKIASALSESVGTNVSVGECSFGWTSGLQVRDVQVANPPGFPTDQPMVALAELHGGVSWTKLVGGDYSVDLHAKGLRARIVQKRDGSTNAEDLQKRRPKAESRPADGTSGRKGSEDPKAAAFWNKLRIDVTLVDSAIEVRHEDRGLLEALDKVELKIKKDLGATPFRCTFGAALQAGRIDFEATVDPSLATPMHVKLASSGIELERYKPLLAPFLAEGDLTALAGKLGGEVTFDVDPREERVRSHGKLTVESPHVAGALLRGADLRAALWTLEPNLDVAFGKGAETLDASGLHGAFGVAGFDGIPNAEATALAGAPRALGCAFMLDLGQLGALGGPIPANLRDANGIVRGKLAVAVPERIDAMRDGGWKRALRLVTRFETPQAGFLGQKLSDYGGELRVADGKLTLGSATGSAGKLNGGPFSLALAAALDDTAQMPTEVKLQWNGGAVGAGAVPVLQYFVPMLAGLSGAANLDFQSKIDTVMSFRGPMLAKPGQSVLEWLNEWSGTGDLHLLQGSFTPSQELSSLLELTGLGKKLAFDKLGGAFQLDQGYVVTALSEFDGAAKKLGFKGRTSLSGQIEYGIDVSSLLAGHKDGEKIRKALGNRPLEAGLAGTLTSPRIALPDLGKLVLQGAVDDLQKGQLPGILDGIFGKKKKQ